jgi:hypothetical protein
MQSEFKTFLTETVTQYRINERHNRSFQANIVLVLSRATIQIVDDSLEEESVLDSSKSRSVSRSSHRRNVYLKSSSLGRKNLIVRHRFQNLLMTTGYQTRSAQNLEHGNLSLHVFRLQTLRYRFDGCRVSEHVRSASLKRKKR